MNSYFLYVFEVSVCITAFYLLYLLYINRQPVFLLSRFYLLLSILLSFTIPLLSFSSSLYPVGETLTVYLKEVVATSSPVSSVSPSVYTTEGVVLVIYLTIVGLLTLQFSSRLLKIIRIIRSGRWSSWNGYPVLKSPRIESTGSFLGYILWKDSQNLTDNEKEIILEHEMVHIRQLHTVDILLSEIAGIVLWFNPVVHFIKGHIKRNHEYIADQSISEKNHTEYLCLMAKQALIQNDLLLTSSFGDNQIINRINMLKSRRRWSSGTRYLLTVPLILLLFFTFACEENAPVFQEEAQDVTELEVEKLRQQRNEVNGEVFTVVESPPVPQGGFTEYFQYIAENLKYPKSAYKNGIEGKVFVQFIVTKDGKVSEAKVVKGIDPECDEAARMVVEKSPDWSPGTQRDQNVNVRMTLPITFKISK